MARIELRPDRWALVDYDPDEVRALAESMADAAGLPADLEVVVELDDSSPLGRYSLDSMDPVLVSMESGAFEDPKHPRQLSTSGTAGVLGRLFLRVADRLTDGWADVPEDAELTPEQGVAWEVHAAGRLARRGQQAQRQRWRYHFRNRHGFSDEADAAFDRLWSADALTWAEVRDLSDRARAAAPAIPSS